MIYAYFETKYAGYILHPSRATPESHLRVSSYVPCLPVGFNQWEIIKEDWRVWGERGQGMQFPVSHTVSLPACRIPSQKGAVSPIMTCSTEFSFRLEF